MAGAPHGCKAASGRPLLFLNPWSDCEWAKTANQPAEESGDKPASYWTCRVPIGGLREPIIVPGGMVSDGRNRQVLRVRDKMPRRPAQLTQADVARVIRAAKQAGASEVVVKVGDLSLIVRLTPSTGVEVPLALPEEIVL